MTRNDMIKYLKELDIIATMNKTKIDLYIYGGSALALGYKLRETTEDIDAVFSNATETRKFIEQVANYNNLPSDWLNDGIKGFILDNFDYIKSHCKFRSLSIYFHTIECMLAMKAVTIREENNKDISDIKALVNEIGLKSYNDVINIIEKYYPRRLIKPGVEYRLREILEELFGTIVNLVSINDITIEYKIEGLSLYLLREDIEYPKEAIYLGKGKILINNIQYNCKEKF